MSSNSVTRCSTSFSILPRSRSSKRSRPGTGTACLSRLRSCLAWTDSVGSRILVTGGAGYIGSVVVEQLVSRGHAVVVLDDLSRGHRAAVDPGAEFVQGGIGDRRVLDGLLTRHSFDALVHLAAYALVAESVAHPEMYFANNVAAGRVLLDAVAAAGVGRGVFSSSCAVYGHPPVIPLPEDAPRAPVNPYGQTKLEVEHPLGGYTPRHHV